MNPDARSLALHRLSVREYGSQELKRYLVQKGVAQEEADETIRSLLGEGSLDDMRYARVIARHHSLRGKGPMYILTKLREKGVNTVGLQKIRSLLEEISDLPQRTELDRAQTVMDRRYPEVKNTQDKKVLKRAYEGLVRRGFSREVAAQCLKNPK